MRPFVVPHAVDDGYVRRPELYDEATGEFDCAEFLARRERMDTLSARHSGVVLAAVLANEVTCT
jgi:hypothetical protein